MISLSSTCLAGESLLRVYLGLRSRGSRVLGAFLRAFVFVGQAGECEVSIAYDLSEEAEFVENRILRVAEQARVKEFACWGFRDFRRFPNNADNARQAGPIDK